MANWKEIKSEELERNPFKMIGKDWMVVTAEKENKINMMTASWGGVGVMWGKNVAFVVIRPQRYTKEFIDASDTFSLSFYDESYRKTLNYLGSISGRNEDKVINSGLTICHEDEIPFFEEANMAILCKKMFAQEIKPDSFIQQDLIEKWYPNADFHTLYIAEIIKMIVKD